LCQSTSAITEVNCSIDEASSIATVAPSKRFRGETRCAV
jgi:hypothetical protein